MTTDHPAFLTFGVDPGSLSGWAIANDPNSVLTSGTAKTVAERFDAVETAEAYAREMGLPLVGVVENWGSGGWRTVATAIGLGRSLGRWLELIELILGIRERDLVRPHPKTWQHHFFEHGMIQGKKSEEMKGIACAFTGAADHNEAEACCLAMYGQGSVEGIEAAEKAARRLQRRRARR